jgi:hypothetical protein
MKMQAHRIWRRALLSVGGVGLLLLGLLLYMQFGPREVPPGQPAFLRLHSENFHELSTRFNAGSGGQRVLVMLSPT